MDITQTRRKQLTRWFQDKPLPVAEKSYIFQLINGKSSFGERAARRLEKEYAMPAYYLDNQEHDQSPVRWIYLPIYTTRSGPLQLFDTHQETEMFPVPIEVMNRYSLGLKDCLLLRIDGDTSMSPFVDNHGIVLVNMKDRNIHSGEVYAVQGPDSTFVKRLFQQMDGRIRIESFDSAHGIEYCTPGKDINILGKVVWRAS